LRRYCFRFGSSTVSNHAAHTHGSFAVGRAIYDWTDDANVDTWRRSPEASANSCLDLVSSGVGNQLPPTSTCRSIAAEVERDLAWSWRIADARFVEVHSHSLRNSDVSAQQDHTLCDHESGASLKSGTIRRSPRPGQSRIRRRGFDVPIHECRRFPDGRVMRRTPDNNAELCEARSKRTESAV